MATFNINALVYAQACDDSLNYSIIPDINEGICERVDEIFHEISIEQNNSHFFIKYFPVQD